MAKVYVALNPFQTICFYQCQRKIVILKDENLTSNRVCIILIEIKCFFRDLRASNTLQKLSKTLHGCVPYRLQITCFLPNYVRLQHLSCLALATNSSFKHSATQQFLIYHCFDQNLLKLRCFLQKLRRPPLSFQLSFCKTVSICRILSQKQKKFQVQEHCLFQRCSRYHWLQYVVVYYLLKQ